MSRSSSAGARSRLALLPQRGNRRTFGLAALAAVVLLGLLAAPAIGQRSERAKVLSKKLMCMCGCNQILGECNHVGCSVSTEMLRKLDTQVERGDADDLVMQAFVQEYGLKVLAQPPASGFNLMAWVVPPVALLFGLLIVRSVLRRWRSAAAQRATVAAAGYGGAAVSEELLERVRKQSGQEAE
jgi:cytochrome c-type biogenesis protein CcmH